MARARNIKPGFFKNADLVELPMEARLLFIGLWTMADRAGRLEDRPKQIKMELFPADSVDVGACLDGLQRWGFVRRYEIDGLRLIQIVNFNKHQNPHKDEKLSSLPDEDGQFDKPKEKHGAGTVQAPCEVDSDTVAIGLIPDSLIPDSSTVEAPAAPRAEPALGLQFLNSELVDPKHAADWLKVRKTKRAPLTETAWKALCREAEKARISPAKAVQVCAENSWQSFKADWYGAQAHGPPQRGRYALPTTTTPSSAAERTAAEMAERMSHMDNHESRAAAEEARRKFNESRKAAA